MWKYLLLFLLLCGCDLFDSNSDSDIISGEILFISIRNGQTIILSDSSGTNQYQLTNKNEYQYSAEFSPDGKSIIFEAYNRGNSTSTSIYQFDFQEKKEYQLTDDAANDFSPTISNHGEKIIFTSKRSEPGVYSIVPDESDNIFVECAFASNSEFLISGNTKDFKKGELKGLNFKLLTPKEFYKIWRNNE